MVVGLAPLGALLLSCTMPLPTGSHDVNGGPRADAGVTTKAIVPASTAATPPRATAVLLFKTSTPIDGLFMVDHLIFL
jgi:hypothetical protein